MGYPLEDYTCAEILQMWAEKLRDQWWHTSTVASYIVNVNRAKKTDRKITPSELSPMESQQTQKVGIPLNSSEGFDALRSVASAWRPRR